MSTAITYITTTVFVVSARSTRRGSKHVYKKMEFVMPSLIEEKEKRNHKKKKERKEEEDFGQMNLHSFHRQKRADDAAGWI